MKKNDYAVIFENDNIYLISPCEENEKNILRIRTDIQAEISKKDIVVIEKRYVRIRSM